MKKLWFLFPMLIILFGCFEQSTPEPIVLDEQLSVPVQSNNTTQIIETQPEPTPLEIANQTAFEFAILSSTYAYDGFGMTLLNYSEGDEFTFTYLYNSQYAGFGNRSEFYLKSSLRTHTLVLTVVDSEVTSAILDGVYNELELGMVDVAETFDFDLVSLETCKELAIDFVEQSNVFQTKVYQGMSAWTNNASVTRLSDTLCQVRVFIPTSSDGQYYESVYVFVDHDVVFFPNSNSQRSWIDIYMDPNADYSIILTPLPNPLCPPGQLMATSTHLKFCFEPTITNNMPCSSSVSCERGACVRTSMGEFGTPTKCFDYPFGCRYWVAENNQPAKLVCLS
ncbi:MAG: hypothetical protein ABH842_00285 [Candidatus Micrarchaeota archaeon]